MHCGRAAVLQSQYGAGIDLNNTAATTVAHLDHMAVEVKCDAF